VPDYMEALISQKGLSQVIDDLHTVVKDMAEEQKNNNSLWSTEIDLEIIYEDLKENGW